jgi:hypothetical protein
VLCSAERVLATTTTKTTTTTTTTTTRTKNQELTAISETGEEMFSKVSQGFSICKDVFET